MLAIIIGATLLGASVGVAEASLLEKSEGERQRPALCGPGDQPVNVDEFDHHDDGSHDHSQETLFPTSEDAAKAYIGTIKRDISSESSQLRDGNPEINAALVDFFESEAFAPGRRLSVGDEVEETDKGTVYSRRAENGWVDVRLEVREIHDGFAVSTAYVCESAVTESGALASEQVRLEQRIRAELDRQLKTEVER